MTAAFNRMDFRNSSVFQADAAGLSSLLVTIFFQQLTPVSSACCYHWRRKIWQSRHVEHLLLVSPHGSLGFAGQVRFQIARISFALTEPDPSYLQASPLSESRYEASATTIMFQNGHENGKLLFFSTCTYGEIPLWDSKRRNFKHFRGCVYMYSNYSHKSQLIQKEKDVFQLIILTLSTADPNVRKNMYSN